MFPQNTPAYDNVPSKFGCKKINSSADMVETVTFDQMSLYCDPELEDSKPIFLHILAHDVASLYQIWLQKVQQQRRTFTGILNLFCDLDLDHNRAIQSFHKTIHLMMMCHQTKFTYKRISSSCNILKRQILMILFLL